MSDLNRFKDVAVYESVLQDLAWTINMSQGEFSLILVRGNYAKLREQMVQRLRELCSVEIREIVLDKSLKRLYSTIQEQLGDEQPPAVIVFGLEAVSDIDQVLISMNRVREEFRKNFHFPLVLWIDDQILKKLIRLVPDFESWATTIEFALATNGSTHYTQESADEVVQQVQHHESEGFNTLNERSLQTLVRAIKMAQGAFGLFLVRCNYSSLRERMLQQLREICPVKFQELVLEKSVKRLFTAIQDELGQKQPSALMVSGLESVTDLDQLLTATNQFPEEFRNHFHFPLVLWVTDEVLTKLIRLAPEFESWATSNEFVLTTEELIDFLRQSTNGIFAAVLEAGAGKFLLNSVNLYPCSCWELESARKDLQSRGYKLDAALEANVEFVLGRDAYANDQIHDALAHYQKSIALWSQGKNLDRQGIVLFCIGLCYQRQAEVNQAECSTYWKEAKYYLQRCIEIFEQEQRQDLVAKSINPLGDVLQCLEAWDDLQVLALKSLNLHQIYGSQVELAQDYGFLAQVALNRSNWEQARELSQQALQTLTKASEEQRQNQGLYLLLLAKSQQQLGQLEKAINSIERAKQVSDSHYDLKLYIRILEELRSLYSEQSQYLNAFQIKRELRLIERQYGLTAFVGAELLQPLSSVQSPLDFETQQAVALEIAASGRLQVLERLIERMARNDIKLTVILGPSGVGKSSLLNAGLIPALKQKSMGTRDVLPIFLRSYTDWSRTLGAALAYGLEQIGDSLPPVKDFATAILQQLMENADRNLLTVLIFDQFEEFFFVYTERTQRRLFFEFLRMCLDIRFVKVILSMREDYLHCLLELNRLGDMYVIDNNILQKNILYFLDNFSQEEAKVLIQHLTQRSDFYLEPALVDQLVHDLAAEQGEVRPVELQIIGQQLQAEKIATLSQYQERGSKEELIKRFLEEIVEDCGFEHEDVTWLVLYLLTNKNGTRPLKTRRELALVSELESEKLDFVLDVLVKSGLVLLVPEAPEDRYQLVHDYLVTFIRQKQESTGLVDVEVELKLTKGQLRQALHEQQIAKIRALNSSSQALLLSHDQLGALVAGLEAGRTLQQITARSEVKIETVCSLRQAVYSVRERNRFQGHGAGVNSISFSPNGQTLASASEDGTVKLWQSDGNQLQTLRGHGNRVTSLSFSPDEKTLISAGGDGTLKLWRLVDGTELQTLQGHDNRVTSVSFSPDGQTVASASEDGTVKLWRIIGSKLQIFNEYDDLVYDLSFSPDSQTLACASEDGKVKLWHLDSTEVQTFQCQGNRVTSINFSPDGQTLVSASLDGTVKLWHFNGLELEELKSFQAHRDWVTSVSFSPDGQTIASASEDGSVKLWSLEGNELQIFRGHRDKVTSISFSPNRQTLASTSGNGTVKLWSLRGNELQIFRGHCDKVTSVSFSPDGQTVASADENGTLKLWHSNGTERETRHNHRSRVTSISFSPNGQTLASSDEEGNVEFWSSDCNELLFPLLHTDGVTSVSFSPDGQALAFAGEDGTIELRSKDGADLKASCKCGERVTRISFSPDSQTLASAGGDGVVKLWRFIGTQLQELKTFQAHSKRVASISFSPDGQTLASASEDCTVKLWSLDGTELQVFRGHSQRVTSISFSPDGQTLASASEDCTVKLWNLDGTEVQTFKGHGNWVTDVSFSPDGHTLASASRDGTVILWNLNLDDLLERASNWLRDYLKTNPNVNRVSTSQNYTR
jgi:WD40 repeat protein/tetratricopeptide (TPR) repeat protein